MNFAESLLARRGYRITEANFSDMKEVTSADWSSALKREWPQVKIETDSKNKDPDKRGRLVAAVQNKQVGYFDDKTEGRCSITTKSGTSIGKPVKGFTESMDLVYTKNFIK